MMILATLGFVGASVGLALLIAHATLNMVFGLFGMTQRVLVRWDLLAFVGMLFWTWYLAPVLSAM